MPQNFIESSRDKAFLLPPSLRDWLPSDHLAWFAIKAVEQIDLEAFFAAYRADGLGRAAYDPAMMVALILHAFATGERSSRQIECYCRQDVAYRVVCGNLVPDHATIARFLRRHERALSGLLGVSRSSFHTTSSPTRTNRATSVQAPLRASIATRASWSSCSARSGKRAVARPVGSSCSSHRRRRSQRVFSAMRLSDDTPC